MLKFSSDPGWMMRLIKKISVRTAAAATAIALVFCGCLCESEHSGDSEETAEGSAPVITVQPADVTWLAVVLQKERFGAVVGLERA